MGHHKGLSQWYDPEATLRDTTTMEIPADISGLSIEQLLEQQQLISKAIEARRAEQRTAGLKKILEIMLELGLRPKELANALADMQGTPEAAFDAPVSVTVTGKQGGSRSRIEPSIVPVVVEQEAAQNVRTVAVQGERRDASTVTQSRAVGRPARAKDGVEGRGKKDGGVRQASVTTLKPFKGGHKVVQKYRDPETGNGWSGMGLKPRWLIEKLADGAKLEDFLIG